MNGHQKHAIILLFISAFLFEVSLPSSILHAQPSLTEIKAEKLRPGEVSELTLLGTGFNGIRTINNVKIGDFDIAILEQDIASDSAIALTIRIPKQITPGTYRFAAGYSGFTRSGQLAYDIQAEPKAELLFRNAAIPSGDTKQLDFDSTTVGKPMTRHFQINNRGLTPLILSNLELPDGFGLDGAFPDSIRPGDGAFFYIELKAASPGTYGGTLSFRTNEQKNSQVRLEIAGKVRAVPTPPSPVEEQTSAQSFPPGSEPIESPETESPSQPLEPQTERQSEGSGTLGLGIAIAGAAVLSSALLLRNFRARRRKRRKRQKESELKFEAKIDLGIATIKQTNLVRTDLELRLQPVMDWGKITISHKASRLLEPPPLNSPLAKGGK